MSTYIKVFLIAMLPIIELRGAIPFATALGVELPTAYALSILGNMVPVPFILLFSEKVLLFGKDIPLLKKPFHYILKKGYRAGKKLEDKAGFTLFLALTLFVGIPLPGTGAWMGSLAAALLGIDRKKSIFAVLIGVLLSGLIMSLVSFGVFSLIKY